MSMSAPRKKTDKNSRAGVRSTKAAPPAPPEPAVASTPASPLHTVATTVFLLAAFLAPGAWIIVTIPSPEKAQLCFVLATLVCLALVCVKALPLRRPSPRALLAAGFIVAAFLLALLTNIFPAQQFLYDLYGEMPGFVWLCYPVVFLLAASIGLGAWARPALRVVTLVGLLLVAVALFQRFTTPWVTVFGSSAYNVSALIALPVLALWLATTESRARYVWAWRLAALLSAVAIALISYGLLGIFAVIALALLIAALRPQLLGLPSARAYKVVQLGGRIALALLALALVVVLLPQTSGLLVNRTNLAGLGSTVGSRMEFSYGAEAMTAQRPLTGFGPAGYRFSAYRYLDKWLYGDTGTIGADPIAYSPPSPHSLPWEAVTRLGLIGALALLAAAVFWLREVQDHTGLLKLQKARQNANPAASTRNKKTSAAAIAPAPDPLIDLRAACAIAALAWLLSLFVTPMHFASGLLGAALAGLACARPQLTGVDALSLPSAGKIAARVLACAALVVVAVLVARQQIALASAQTVVATTGDDLARLERVAKVAPGQPMIERRLLEDRLMLASDTASLQSAIKAVQTAPGYITDFTPDATLFAQIIMDQMSALKLSDPTMTAAVSDLLDRAASVGPPTPALLGERLRLALISGDTAAQQQAKAQVRRLQFNGKSAKDLYPPIADYLAGKTD